MPINRFLVNPETNNVVLQRVGVIRTVLYQTSVSTSVGSASARTDSRGTSVASAR